MKSFFPTESEQANQNDPEDEITLFKRIVNRNKEILMSINIVKKSNIHICPDCYLFIESLECSSFF